MTAAATTRYQVVTSYRTEAGQATSGLAGYRREAESTTRALRGTQVATRDWGMTALVWGSRIAATLGAGMIAHRAIGATFSNLNTELNSSIQLASQLNLAFEYSSDPVQNFSRSLGDARGLIRDLATDAARLPGELSDFISVSRQISGAVFAGGGSIDTLRQLTARVALAAPAAGQTTDDAGRQTMRALFGTASVGDNPLFAMMLGSQLFGPGMDAERFNKLPAAERLQKFDEALARLTDNPMFRSEIIRTFDTQIGTLADNLFGMEGLLTRMGGRELYEAALSGLVSLNEAIETYTPGIVSGFDSLRTQIGFLWEILSNFTGAIQPAGVGRVSQEQDRIGKEIRSFFGYVKDSVLAEAMVLSNWARHGIPLGPGGQPRSYYEQVYEAHARMQAAQRGPGAAEGLLGGGIAGAFAGSGKPPPRGGTGGLPTAGTVVYQTNHITVDLKSDDSPEGIAVKLASAMEKAEKHPTRSRRAPTLGQHGHAFRI